MRSLAETLKLHSTDLQGVTDDTQVHDDNNDVVPPSPPVLQQPTRSIAVDRPKRNCEPRPRLIEENC